MCSCAMVCSPAHAPMQITFERDVMVSVENEYEVLQLIMGDLRDK